ncbi:Ig kappa chain V-II region MOPC 511 [Channa argus]|uniref:Ig kappa chain V-II region MOPC 511 n=2 Tax=Channa argus TaxID=215402 RepID=A0A6G1PVC4_CHAAH|nr:Ig kappa chain V-II region MOPC 511 [Channa argus]
MKVKQLDMTFLKGVFLRIKGPEPDVTAIIQEPLSDPVHAGDSVTLQCSVLSESEGKMCPGRHSVYWFRAGSEKSQPSLIYTHGNRSDQCESGSDARSPQKCFYSFSKIISFSDAGTYYCAVATCGQILFGNGTKVDIEETSIWLQTTNAVIFLLCVILALSHIVMFHLIPAFKINHCNSCSEYEAGTEKSDKP